MVTGISRQLLNNSSDEIEIFISLILFSKKLKVCVESDESLARLLFNGALNECRFLFCEYVYAN